MSDRPRGFSDETQQTPLIRIQGGKAGPKRPCLVVIAGPRLGEVVPVTGEVIIGREPGVQLGLPEDEGVSRRHARITPLADGALVTDLGSANGTYVDGEKVSERILREGAKIRIGQTTVIKFTLFDGMEEVAQRQLLEAALRDSMTGAFNRRYFMQRLSAELRFAERHKSTVALLMIDLDHFKQINDRLGHPAGDAILKQLSDVVSGTLRAEDVLARYGGEEFAVLTRGISAIGAQLLGERLRALVAGGSFAYDSEPVPLTISVGLAVFPFDDGPPEAASQLLIERADAALYRAKRAGRNRVAV